jgi:hypothetical protein
VPEANDPDVWLRTASEFESYPGRLSRTLGHSAVLISTSLLDTPEPLEMVVDVEPGPVVAEVFAIDRIADLGDGLTAACARHRVTRSLAPGPVAAIAWRPEVGTEPGWTPNAAVHPTVPPHVQAAPTRFRSPFTVTDLRGLHEVAIVANVATGETWPAGIAGNVAGKGFWCSIFPRLCPG